jgi:agmatine deiminase
MSTDPSKIRMPAEWEPHEAIWLQWPAEEMRDLSGYHAKLESTWLEMTRALQPHVRVRIIATDEPARDRLARQLPAFGIESANVELYVAALDDVWTRDDGPVFVVNESGAVSATSWRFNGWGRRAPHGRDAQIASRVAQMLGMPCRDAGLVSEGGAFEVDGAGSLLATRSALLNSNRNPGLAQQDVEHVFRELLGVTNVLWLSGAPPDVCERLGDCTDWHIDLTARFTPQHAILCAEVSDEADPRHRWVARHQLELAGVADVQGRAYDLVSLPSPELLTVNPVELEAGVLGRPGSLRDASYTNYLVTNGIVLVPMYGQRSDERARSVLAEHFPDREVVGISSLAVSEEGGAIHCVTQQQPRGRADPG